MGASSITFETERTGETPALRERHTAMIDFSCPQCRAAFSVPEHLAGRRAKCKSCGAGLVVPQPAPPPPVVAPVAPPQAVMVDDLPPPPKIPMRIRRLRADAEQMARAFKDFP